MTTNFNPSNPDTSGIEWLPTRRLPKALSGSAGVGVTIAATATETIAQIKAFLTQTGAARRVIVDVYDLNAGDPWDGNDATALCLPTVDGSHQAGWTLYSSGGVPVTPWVNGFGYVDEVMAASSALSGSVPGFIAYSGVNPTTAPHIQFANDDATFVDGEAGIASSTITSKRIRTVTVIAVVENTTSSTVGFALQLRLGSVNYSITTSIPGNSPLLRYTAEWTENPATGRPWTHADAVNLSNGTNFFGVAVVTKGAAGDFQVTALNLQFDTAIEDRVATASAFAATGGDGGYSTFGMLDPADNTTQAWARVSGHTYLYAYSVCGDGGNAFLVGVDDSGIAGGGLTGWDGADIPARATLVPGPAAPTYNAWLPAMFHVTSAPALGADRQPYAKIAAQAVYTGVGNVRQGIAAHATAAYGGASILLARPSITPTAPLILRIRTVSGNTQVGGDITIDPADVTYNAQGFALVRALAASNASLASGTGYYLDIVSATPVGAPWQVCYAATDFSATTDGTTVAAGTITGAATLAGTANALADILANIQTAPAAPGALAGSPQSVVQSPATPGGPVTIGYAHLDWTSTSMGGSFAYYEVQRDQVTIACITDESKSFFNDFESRRGVASAYRVRAVRSDGAMSDWTT